MNNLSNYLLSLCLVTGLFACQRQVVNVRIDGKLSEKYQIDRQSKQKDGFYRSYHLNRRIAIEQAYKAGAINGPITTYYETGQVESIKNTQEGVFQGSFVFYYPDGKVMQQGNYQSDDIYGDLRSYYPNGQVKEVVFMKGSEENGPFREYSEEGVLLAEGNYISMGERPALEHGLLYIYDKATRKLIKKMRCWEGHCCTIWSLEKGYVPPSSNLCRQIIDKKTIDLENVPSSSEKDN